MARHPLFGDPRRLTPSSSARMRALCVALERTVQPLLSTAPFSGPDSAADAGQVAVAIWNIACLGPTVDASAMLAGVLRSLGTDTPIDAVLAAYRVAGEAGARGLGAVAALHTVVDSDGSPHLYAMPWAG